MGVWSLKTSFFFFLCCKFWQEIDLKYGKFSTSNGSRDNVKSAENICMKLEKLVDGSLEIKYILFFYVEKSGKYDNK
jgi:hypothetical protein